MRSSAWHETVHLVYYRAVPTVASRDTVLTAARSALGSDQSLTMSELASATGVSLRQLYRLFGSRESLLKELDLEPLPPARARILEAALELLGRSSLADLSMDELADHANVSRATVYRLFPGKSALFRELIATYSPWESIARVLDQHRTSADNSLQAVIPQVSRALAEALSGRSGVLLRMVLEMSRGAPDTSEGIHRSMLRGLPDLIQYLTEQMAEGRMRKSHPVLALQMLAGPIVAHELTRPLAALVGFDAPREQVVDQIVDLWLRAMAPDEDTPSATTA
jgi:AcrR family transcriptional regulator